MKSLPEHIAPLKKIDLELTLTNGGGQSTGDEAVRHQLTFIYGVASSGLTPFEFKISNLKLGDTLSVKLRPGEWEAFFGHLPFHWPDTLADDSPCQVTINVQAIETPSQREIIQALADVTACGDGCCGNH